MYAQDSCSPYVKRENTPIRVLDGEIVFSIRIFRTPVNINVKVLPIIMIVWGGITYLGMYLHPGRTIWQGLLIGFVSMIFLFVIEFGHALAHIFSARFAGAPVDEILISGELPRTLYKNNDVSARTHCMRALGGPIFNFIGFLLSFGIFKLFPGIPLIRELSALSAIGHALQFMMSLAPLPMIDGGSILKWTLVVNGKTVNKADEIVKRVDWVFGSIFIITAIILIFMKWWAAGIFVFILGGVILGITSGKIH